MTLIMRDSIDAPLIPTDTPVVAGYGDGAFIWSPSWKDGSNWWDLFPNSTKLVIVVNAAHSGDILDVESGDATPSEVPGWCDRFNRPGRRAPTVYCNRSTWPLVQKAVGARQVDYWISTLDETQFLPGAVAVQYFDNGAYDESLIWDTAWVGAEVDPPSPPTTLSAGGEAFMVRVNYNGFIHRMWVDKSGTPRWTAIEGGSGGVLGSSGPAGALGTPPAGLTAVAGTLAVCDDAFQGVPRLSAECQWSDGQVRQCVVVAQPPWTVVADWAVIDTDPPPATPQEGSQPVAHTHPVTVSTTTGAAQPS